MDKQSLKRVVVDTLTMDKAKYDFMGRLERGRAKEEKKVLAPVVEFSKYKKS